MHHAAIRVDSIFFFQAEDGIRDIGVTGVQTCALPISDAEERWVTHGGDRGVPPGGDSVAPHRRVTNVTGRGVRHSGASTAETLRHDHLFVLTRSGPRVYLTAPRNFGPDCEVGHSRGVRRRRVAAPSPH